MKYDLKRPCKECPFRNDRERPWWHSGERAEEMVYRQDTFPCHKTTEFDDEGEQLTRQNTQACAGHLIMLEHAEQPNQLMRIAERLGAYDPATLDMDSPVWDDPQEYIDFHYDECG